VAYRGFVQKVASMLVPWFLPFCMLGVFGHEVNGVRVLSAIIGVVVIVLAISTFLGTRERTQVDMSQKKEGFITAVTGVARNPHFLRITAIFALMVSLFALFSIFNAYVNIYYVFGGDKLKGASISAVMGTLGAFLAMAGIPLVAWLSKKIQKHNALKISLWLMITGEVLKFFLMRPEHPWAQIAVPFFFSLGVSCTFTILGSMQADVVDMDELASGRRREGIFGAVAGWMMKSAGALATALSGYILIWTGFDAALGAAQSESTFLWLRVMNSFAPAAMASTCLLLLYRYPLTEKRMHEVKQILVDRRRQRDAK
jgi:GPH family glycoside/pentoside/hexuronide:cation symporter